MHDVLVLFLVRFVLEYLLLIWLPAVLLISDDLLFVWLIGWEGGTTGTPRR